jgi:hypothetical protein
MTFARLTRGDWVAAVAALALLLVMAMDWYTTEAGQEARTQEKQTQPRGATAGEVGRAVDERARIAAEEAEQNAWQADPFPDRIILVFLLASIVLAIAAAFLRAAAIRFEPPWTPSAMATIIGLFTAVLVATRIVQKPSVDIGAVIKLGAPLGLVCVGTLALGARAAWNAERDGSAWGEGPQRKDRKPDPFADTDETDAVSSKPPPLFDHSPPPDAEPAPEAEAATATVVRPAPPVREDDEYDEAWAPEWSDPAAPAPEPAEPDAERTRRRRRQSRRGAKRGRGGRRK